MIERTLNVTLILLVVEYRFLRVFVSNVHIVPLSTSGTVIAIPTLLHLLPPIHLELRHIESVHIVHVRVNPPRQLQAVVEDLPSVPGETLLPELEPGIDELDVRSFSKSVVDDSLVLVDSYGTGRVNDVSPRFGLGVYTVDRTEDELFLEVGEEHKIFVRLRGTFKFEIMS